MRRRSCAGPAAGECGRGGPEVRRRWRAGNSSFAFRRRRPRAGAAGRVASGPGAAQRGGRATGFLPTELSVGKVGWCGTPAGQAGRSPGQTSGSVRRSVTGGRRVRGFPKRPSAWGVRAGATRSERPWGRRDEGAPGASRCAGSRGDRGNWEWPLSERGGRWGDRGPG